MHWRARAFATSKKSKQVWQVDQMAQNVEIKAKLEPNEFESVKERAAAIATDAPIRFEQVDTFFACTKGRLKLREFADGSAELIAYERPDVTGPKTSSYVRSKCEPDSMKSALDNSLGTIGVVKKSREVFFVGPTRVHLDRVDGLGTFLELEVVLDGQTDEPVNEKSGQKMAHEILAQLEVSNSSLIGVAYFDLLQAKHSTA